MSKNAWKIGDAKQQFSEVLRRSEKEPQLIYRRNELIAAVVKATDPATVTGTTQPSLSDRFAEARELFRREEYRLPEVRRRNRRNRFPEMLDAVARRHKRTE